MPDLTSAEERTLAWRTLPCRSPACLQPAGRRCITASGQRTTPHAPRLDDIRVWLTRQPEVDALTAEADRLAEMTTTLRAEHEALTIRFDQVDGARARAEQALADEKAAHAQTRETAARVIADLRRRVAELEGPEPERLAFGVGLDVIGNVETLAGAPVGYHRTYHTLLASGAHTDAVARARADLAAGRTPVLSFKLPGKSLDWAGAAAGRFDQPVKATVDALAALGGTVIVAIHHEPEDDGTLADYRAMTAHYVPLVKRPTVQFWSCFMGYHQLYGTSAWKLEQVHVPGVDGIGFDPYLSFGASSTKWTDQTDRYYAKFGAFAARVGVQWGVWETGINEQASGSGRPEAATWFADCAAGAKANGATMWCYFNSETTKDGKHDWRLTTTGANKLAQMVAVVKQYARQ